MMLSIPKVSIRIASLFAAVTLTAISLTGCSSSSSLASQLTVVVHDSVVITDAQLAEFTKQTGIEVTLVKAGDAGAMTNKLVLTKDQPIGDLVYGIDNTFASVATSNNVIAGDLSAIDYGDVCLNYDKTWFASHELAAPTSLDDLIKSDYQGLTVVENPNTSSTGLGFLAASVAQYGDAGWQTYWRALKNNDVKIDAGWEDAYYTDFSGSSGKGNYPIVLSYSSSPADEVRDNGESQTAAILGGCYRQTEYAGVLTGTKNLGGAKKFIEFLLSDKFQASIPGSMYMYPVSKTVSLPDSWAQFAPAADQPIGKDLDVNANRATWLKAWTSIFG
ncbi:MAG: hypothetical protein RLZZ164_383 [Actinomycetota bacterium]|jgi:thiamine transport system substrate-binding protein